MLMTKIPGKPNFGLCAPLAYDYDPAMTQPKSQISNIEYDGTSSIRNLTLIRTKRKTKQKYISLKLFINFYGNF
jgi:hypothetical protein